MRRYQKWALTLGIMAATPGIASAAGPLSLLKPKSAAESAAPSATKQTNQKVADEIGRALRGAQLKGFDIEIEYKNGVATLSGKIADARQKAQATRLASEIAGVKRVDNQLTVISAAGAQAAGRGAAPSTRPRSMIRQVSGEVAEAAPV
ncbi:MAG: BON domain-containing protein, partial [Planctomycetaceae bacterium]